jgi:hypothetical protein
MFLIFWIAVIFVSFGLSAPRNPTVIATLFVCVLSASGAMFLIQELNQPFKGPFGRLAARRSASERLAHASSASSKPRSSRATMLPRRSERAQEPGELQDVPGSV